MRRSSLTQFISVFLIGIFLFSTCVPAGFAETVYFYHNDHLGSPLAMTDMQGSVVWRRDYKPFGQEIDPGGATTVNTHKYTGKEFDAETGLYYYGARYYDPAIGRFISVDPAGGKPDNPQTWNRYVYTLNNPYKYVDPDGKFLKFAPGSSPQFKQQFKEVVDYLNKGKVSGIIAKLHSRPEVVLVKESSEKNEFYYNPNNRTIIFDPLSGLETTEGKVQTPALGVLHEAAHALEDLTDPDQFIKDVNTEVPAYHTNEERRVIDTIETPSAKKLGEPVRMNHGGIPKQVACPTCKE